MKKIALAGLIVVALAAAVAYSLYSRILGFAEQPLNPDSAELLTVKPGTGRVALASLLEEQKLVADAQWLPWLLRVDPSLAHYKAGTYRLTPGMTVRQLMQLLVSGREAQFSIRFIEGTRFSEWLPILQQAPYLEHDLQGLTNTEIAQKLGIKQGSVEGWLFPDTYHYVAGTSALDILRRAHRRMEKELTIAWDGREKGLPLQSPYEMLTLASIIEKETAIESERTRVSSVFVNRLRLGMRLQTDPTVIYGMGEQYNGNITRKDLQTPTAYNTYTINGLPPTPIAMPGLASLNAAAHP
ncbi:MAG: endolytic transglycosylase MltG, partial [Plesiomonas shigelloides]